MSIETDVCAFIHALEDYSSPNVFNPWTDYDGAYDVDENAPIKRKRNLESYLMPRLGHCPIVVVAEAVGYQGGRFSGIAMTCERMLLGHHPTIKAVQVIPPTLPMHGRTSRIDSPCIAKQTQREKGFNEPTDTVVWGALVENHINPYDVLLWNIFPFHPHKEGVPLSNRTPTETELQAGWVYTRQLLALNGQAIVVAVGKKAAHILGTFGVDAITLRHPANGGANQYREGFRRLITSL